MPRIPFRKKGPQSPGAGGDDEFNESQNDDMTITSGWSFGGSSVSDRIMGRMKMNLSSFGNSGGGSASQRNINSASSVGSRKSARFSGRRTNAYRNPIPMNPEAYSVDGGGRSKSARRLRSSDNFASSVGVEAMEDMDSNEAMSLRGQSMGRRRSHISAPPGRLSELREHSSRRFGAHGTLHTNEAVDLDEPMEYSLSELRSMNENELTSAMQYSGVPMEDIMGTLNDAARIDTSVDTIAEDQRKNLLVALFVNSGHVKLVSKESSSRSLMAERRTTLLSLSMERRTTLSSVGGEQRRTSTLSSIGTDNNQQLRSSLSPLKQESIRDSAVGGVSFSDTLSVKSSSTRGDKQSRKSKLDKIAELKTNNVKMKRENKSLKKTVKKLLDQLTDVIKEKGELHQTIAEGAAAAAKEESQIQISSLHSIEEVDSKGDVKMLSHQQPPYNVLAYNNDESGSIKSGSRSKPLDTSSRASVSSDKSVSKNITYLKRKLKKEKEAHQDTEFRLKTEIDILTKEADGLQLELGNTLESLDSAKKRARESRESVSNLKRELRNTTTKVKNLTAEAEARDKLIETFTKILLQKVGLEEGGGGVGGLCLTDIVEGLDEEKMGEDQVDESFAALKVL